ncbi:unnamed protein product, partial [Eretmochelys imbricata]
MLPRPPVTPNPTLERDTEMLPRSSVTPNQTQVLVNATFTLTRISADTLLWLWDGASLAPSERLGLSSGNWTLTVPGGTRGDAGTYQCEVGNPVSTERQHRTQCEVGNPVSTETGAYGPDSTRIDPPGPIGLPLGSPLTLTCVSDSVPAPSCRWVLNGTDTKENRSNLTFNPTSLDHQGTYRARLTTPSPASRQVQRS